MSVFSRWRFNALDTWFFRESRPMESIGGSELQSVFPPPVRSVAGAIRHIIGQSQTPPVDWSKWREEAEYTELKALMGDSDGYGKLCFGGPWLTRTLEGGETERLYPAPANLVAAKEKKVLQNPVRLTVGSPYHCDLGPNVRMAEVTADDRADADVKDQKLKPLNSYWVSAKTLQAILSGKNTCASELVSSASLFNSEARLGIARSNATRTVEEGMLYQTKHVRPQQQISVEVDVSGLPANEQPSSGIVRLGGEGRGAAFEVDSLSADSGEFRAMQLASHDLVVVSDVSDARGIILVLLTPMGLSQDTDDYQPLPNFKQAEIAGETVWHGDVNTVKLTLHCAIQGKATREGGWDLANHRPREVQSLVPAGSVYYLTVDDGDIASALQTLHLTQLGAAGESNDDQALGRGLVAAGVWPTTEWVEKE